MAAVQADLKFSSLSSFTVEGRRVFVVHNPRDCRTFDWLIGQRVEIDGHLFIVRHVNSPATVSHGEGQPLAIHVEAA